MYGSPPLRNVLFIHQKVAHLMSDFHGVLVELHFGSALSADSEADGRPDPGVGCTVIDGKAVVVDITEVARVASASGHQPPGVAAPTIAQTFDTIHVAAENRILDESTFVISVISPHTTAVYFYLRRNP